MKKRKFPIRFFSLFVLFWVATVFFIEINFLLAALICFLIVLGLCIWKMDWKRVKNDLLGKQ
jgi:hypothetical protein